MDPNTTYILQATAEENEKSTLNRQKEQTSRCMIAGLLQHKVDRFQAAASKNVDNWFITVHFSSPSKKAIMHLIRVNLSRVHKDLKVETGSDPLQVLITILFYFFLKESSYIFYLQISLTYIIYTKEFQLGSRDKVSFWFF